MSKRRKSGYIVVYPYYGMVYRYQKMLVIYFFANKSNWKVICLMGSHFCWRKGEKVLKVSTGIEKNINGYLKGKELEKARGNYF